jgi:hypothetical protein
MYTPGGEMVWGSVHKRDINSVITEFSKLKLEPFVGKMFSYLFKRNS